MSSSILRDTQGDIEVEIGLPGEGLSCQCGQCDKNMHDHSQIDCRVLMFWYMSV